MAPPSPSPSAGGPAARFAGVLDAASIAAELTDAETVIGNPRSTSEEVADAGVRLQLAFRALAGVPEIDDAVLGLISAESRPTIERVVHARQFVQARSAAMEATEPPTTLPATLPAWTIAAPEHADVLRAHYAEAEALTGIPWYWLAAIHLQETRMGRIIGVSSAGAVGPMQFLPSTWAECCTGDPTDTRDAIIGAATYLQQSGAPTDMAAAVYQYNPNEGYVALVTAYAENLRAVPALYDGYHAWQVFSSTSAGTVRIPVGFTAAEPVDAAEHLAAHPDDAA